MRKIGMVMCMKCAICIESRMRHLSPVCTALMVHQQIAVKSLGLLRYLVQGSIYHFEKITSFVCVHSVRGTRHLLLVRNIAGEKRGGSKWKIETNACYIDLHFYTQLDTSVYLRLYKNESHLQYPLWKGDFISDKEETFSCIFASSRLSYSTYILLAVTVTKWL